VLGQGPQLVGGLCKRVDKNDLDNLDKETYCSFPVTLHPAKLFRNV
jgi:hypothetical protein